LPILPENVLNIPLPRMFRVKQLFDNPELTDPDNVIRQQMVRPEIRAMVKPGARVALAVGSRGIYNLKRIVNEMGNCLKDMGARPFIVPAMGSHGGADAEGQRSVLAGYGITEDTVNMPIVSSMDVVQAGATAGGIPVYIDRHAFEADLIVPLARVKPHTDFKGPIESGLCKMLAIGLGKHQGCSRLHQEGFDRFRELIPAVAQVMLEKCQIGFGVAVVENSCDKTAIIKAVPAESFVTEEIELLKLAKTMMPRIMVPVIDVLIVERIGKEISGAGMDPNIVGRTTKGKLPEFNGPDIQRIIVLDLSEETHGNACGIGLADFTTKHTLNKIDYGATYANVIASANPEAGRLPVVMDGEREALVAALQCCSRIDMNAPRIVRIQDTLHLEYIWLSEALLPLVENNPQLSLAE